VIIIAVHRKYSVIKKVIKPLMSNDTLMTATGRINKNSKFM